MKKIDFENLEKNVFFEKHQIFENLKIFEISNENYLGKIFDFSGFSKIRVFQKNVFFKIFKINFLHDKKYFSLDFFCGS